MLDLNHIFNKIAHGFDKVDRKDRHGDTRLYKAVRRGSLSEVRKLLRDGADPNILSSHHLSPLHQAAYWGDASIVEALLKAGARPNIDNTHGWTPLHSAAVAGGMKSRAEVVELLVAAGADSARKDKNGWTPCDYMALWEANAGAAEKLRAAHAQHGGAPGREEPRKTADRATPGPALKKICTPPH